MAAEPELLLIDKPTGMTSFDVIRVLRRRLGVKKMGHAGTLDPRASGLMCIGVGPGTKELANLSKLDKEYVAEVRIGERRTTGDLEGKVLEAAAVHDLSEAVVETALAGMVGELTLPVSAYSAIKKDGVPLYKKARAAARRGEEFADVPVRTMRVHAAELCGLAHAHERAVATVRFSVGSGTYIRSLAEELGRRLGYPATLQALRRTKVGEYRVADAQPLDRV